jgi:hypothetical protein
MPICMRLPIWMELSFPSQQITSTFYNVFICKTRCKVRLL